MELNRNQFFLFGLVCLAMGVQLRLVDTFVLNEPASRYLAERQIGSSKTASAETSTDGDAKQPVQASTTRRVIRPPDWSGWLLMSVGGVFVLHSLVMRRPG